MNLAFCRQAVAGKHGVRSRRLVRGRAPLGLPYWVRSRRAPVSATPELVGNDRAAIPPGPRIDLTGTERQMESTMVYAYIYPVQAEQRATT